MRRQNPRQLLIPAFLAALGFLWITNDGQLLIAQEATTQPSLDEWVQQLGADNYADREAATAALLAMGPGIAARLQELHDADTDAERRFRIRYVLENIVPPEQAVLVLRAEPNSPLKTGDLITHVNTRRARSVADLQRAQNESGNELLLRVTGAAVPRELARVTVDPTFIFANYRAPRGEQIARAVRLFATGFAEQANDVLHDLGDNVPEDELPPALRARMAYVAGDGKTALALLKDRASVVQPIGRRNLWQDPSQLDLYAPGRAPFRLDMELWTAAQASRDDQNDPDLRVQRVLSAAHRYTDALAADAGYWKDRYRDALATNEASVRTGGNMLAVCSWMLSEIGLESECVRLIEPRSQILRSTPNEASKWLRVRTDAWIPFLRGDAVEALDGFYEHALDVLQRPFADPSSQVIRNPRVAGLVAFFLYQLPQDQRVADTFALVVRAQHPALPTYARAMLFAQTPANNDLIRQHFRELVGVLPISLSSWGRISAAALEYAQKNPDDKWLTDNATAFAEGPLQPEQETTLAILSALQCLAKNQPADAIAALNNLQDHPIAATLRHTAEFQLNPPPGAANQPALNRPIVAVPVGPSAEQSWIVITRDSQLMRLSGGKTEPIAKPSATWIPGACNFPWLGRDETSGRTWCYDRRRIIELTTNVKPPLRMSIDTADIPAFHRLIGPMFDMFAKAVAIGATFDPLTPDGVTPSGLSNETGEYLRNDVRANAEFVSDPDLPELGTIVPIDASGRLWHAAVRGGAHFIIQTKNGLFDKAWTSVWMRDQLKLPRPPVLFPIHSPDPESPVVFLASDQGLLRLDTTANTISRVDLPNNPPNPPLIPESMPYDRADPRWVYFARPPQDGGQIFRLTLENNRVEALDVRNEALPDSYYEVQSRAAIRADASRAIHEKTGMDLLPFIMDATEVVNRWEKARNAENK